MKEIRKIIEAYDSIDFRTEKAALASVVNVEESSYRRIGARMLVRSNGLWIGGISGGCLEGDALKRSQKAIFNDSSSRVVYDTLENDQNQIGVGLGCNGRIEVLFNPLDPEDLHNEIEILRKIITAEQPSIVLKVIESKENPAWLGKIKLHEENAEIDFCSLPYSELQAFIAITKDKRKHGIFETTSKNGEQLKILVEYIRPETRLVIVGDNYDVMALMDIAQVLGWETYVVGNPKKLNKDVYRKAKRVLSFEEIDIIEIHNYSAVILMTHDYNKDKNFLPGFLAKNPRYLGLLGPKKRMIKLQKEIPDLDLSNISYFYSPVGLEIGAESPEEIALSISAEIVAAFREKPAGFLKFKEGTIHERE